LKPDDLPANILPMIPSISALLSASDWTQSPRAALAAFHELASMQLPEALNDPVYEGKASLARPHDVVPSYSYIHQSATVHPGTCMVGNVIICAHCEIGPNAVLFGPTIVGPNSYIGPNAEVRRSLLMSHVKASHACYIGHSIIGRGVNIAAHFVTAVRNLKRHTVHLKLGDELVDTGHELFGAIIADHVEFGVGVTIMPGRCVLESSRIGPKATLLHNH
jgi:NDP-sugar pyrophosphorylase family protein